MNKNVFTYWHGEKNPVIEKLEERLRCVCKNNGYCLHETNESSIRDYIDMPTQIKNLKHIVDITDFYRIKLLSKYSGIWLDKDVLVFRGFDEYFELNEAHAGFVVANRTHKKYYYNNAILGAAPNSPFYKRWEKENEQKLITGGKKFCQLPYGNHFLNKNSEYIGDCDIRIVNGTKTKIDPFIGRFDKRLFSLGSLDKFEKDDPPFVHFYNRNCRKFLSLSEKEKKETMMFYLLEKPYQSS